MRRWRPDRTATPAGGSLVLPDGRALVVTARGGSIRWAGGALVLEGTFPNEGETEGIELRIDHPIVDPVEVWIPHLAPDAGYVIGDAVFRSPAVIVADRSLALALVPDLDDVRAAAGWRAFLDYDHPARAIVLGAGAYREDGHVLFVREPARCAAQQVRLGLYVLASRRPADCANPYGMVARFLWKRWGHAGHERGTGGATALARYMDHTVRWAFSDAGWGETVWQSFELDGEPAGAPVFIVDVTQHPSVPPEERRWREPRSVWNQAWFSTQRCANGLYRYARQIGSADLERRARLMTRLALSAPQDDGLFPSVLTNPEPDGGWDSARWTSSDRRPPSASERGCHLVDAAFTGRMLVEWHALTGEPNALARARRLSERLVALQRPSGAFPGWVEPDGRVVAELADSAETAVSVMLLLELAANRDAALAGIRFLEGVIAAGRWEDFETFYSCCRYGTPELLGRRVARNGVHKQNTLSIAWCAEAMLAAWRTVGERRYLGLARRCIDELSLYQAVWDPRELAAPAHGGFGAMNADSEWNDARQSLFALVYLELYRETGDLELFERGASALRASFSMMYCPENAAVAKAYERRFPRFGPESYGFMMENQGHSGGEPVGEFTIFTWGNGSALAAAATARDRFGDLYLDAPRRRALSIDGVAAEVQGERVIAHDRYERPELLVVYDDGSHRTVPLSGGRASVSLRP